MKVNTKDTDSLFEKGLAKYPLNSDRKTLKPHYKKALEVLAYCIFVGSTSMWQFFNFVSSAKNVLRI